MSSKRIASLKYDDHTWEGEGSSVEEAIQRAIAARIAWFACDGETVADPSGDYDLFLQLRVAADRAVTYRAILR